MNKAAHRGTGGPPMVQLGANDVPCICKHRNVVDVTSDSTWPAMQPMHSKTKPRLSRKMKSPLEQWEQVWIEEIRKDIHLRTRVLVTCISDVRRPGEPAEHSTVWPMKAGGGATKYLWKGSRG